MRLKEFFHGTQSSSESLAKNPSNFTPPPDRDEHLDKYCDFLGSLASNLDSIEAQNKKDNLTRFERSALKELQELVDSFKIVIMPADKGGAIVILDGDHYRQMVLSVFNNSRGFRIGQQYRDILSRYCYLNIVKMLAMKKNRIIQEPNSRLIRMDSFPSCTC